MISNRKTWDNIRDADIKNDEILIALPLYVECVPGFPLGFLGTLPQKDEHTRISFLLQSSYFGIRFLGEEKQAQITKPYQAMGELFGLMKSLANKS